MYFRSEINRLNKAQKDAKGNAEQKQAKLVELAELIGLIEAMPVDFYETHGFELFPPVFRLTFYNHECIFGTDEPSKDATAESHVNSRVHRVCL